MRIATKIPGIEALTLKEPFFIHNIRLFPITGEIGHDGFTTLEEGISSKEIVIEDTRGVNEVTIRNLSEQQFFAIDGEEIIGARQNRILNTDVYIEPHREYTVPVTCIEQHRWSGGQTFAEAGFAVTPSLRSTLALSVNASLNQKKGFISNQSLIWSKIENTLKSTRISSMTSSFHDVYKTLGDMVNELMEGFDSIKDAVGFAAFINDRFIAMDIFASNSLYQKFEKKLLKSYILDGYIRKYTREQGISISPDSIIKNIANTECKTFNSPTKGTELRGLSEGIIVKAYLLEENPLHVSAFAIAGE